MSEIEGTHFTVDQLAERADVSRRTVFNHFGSLDDIVLEVFGEMLESILGDIESGFGTEVGTRPGAIFDELAEALRSTDLVTPITRLKRMLARGGSEPSPSQAALFESAITDVTARLAAMILHRRPQADPLVIDLMCGGLVSGGVVVVHHWERVTGGVDTEDSRRTWAELLDRMISVNRDGYGSVGPGTF